MKTFYCFLLMLSHIDLKHIRSKKILFIKKETILFWNSN